MTFSLEDFLISPNQSMFEALGKLDKNTRGFLMVAQGKALCGVLTDGDIRRALLSGFELAAKVELYATITYTACNVHEEFTKAIDLFKDKKINFLPLINEENNICNVITKKQMQTLLLMDSTPRLTDDFLNVDDSTIDHEVYPRPWGFYKSTVINNFFQGKIIHVYPKGCLSLQYHHRREEYWTVIRGQGVITVGESAINVTTGSTVFIPKGCQHRIRNTSENENLIFSEVQIGDYFGEDDIVRIEDIYDRT